MTLAKEFGWTLDYIDSLDDWQLASIAGTLEAISKYNEMEAKSRNKGRSKHGRKSR